MINRILTFLLAVSLTFSVAAQPRQHINFDEGWKFHFGNAADPVKDFNYGITAIFSKTGKTDNTAIAINYIDSAWRSLSLPHDWAVELPFQKSASFDVMSHGYKPVGGLYPETSIGWYRKHFSVARKDSGQRYQIQFDGVFRNAEFWVNGFYLGNNKSGYVGIAYDLTDYLNFDKENVLTVRVDATQYEGWFYEGAGIYRHVWLNQYNNLHIATDGIFVYTNVQNSKAAVSVETTIQNQDFREKNGSVVSIITNRNGQVIATTKEQPLQVAQGKSAIIKQELSVIKPVLWSIENPYLYRVITLIKSKGKTVDSSNLRFGIRTITIDAAKGFFVNGKHVKIKGTNNHQDHAGVGAAMPDYLQYYRIHLLKELGSNAYRSSHHAPTPELLDACDSLGMLVLDEQRLLNSSPEYMDQFERLLKRDRSRACVFLWSIGNEEGWVQTNNTGRRIAQSLLSKQKELDPTRTSTYAADVANIFNGVNEVIPVRGFNYRQSGAAPYHKDHPLQPVLGTEMGSTVTTRGIYTKDTINNYLPDQDITAPWWASKAEEWWPLAAQNDWWMGGFIWTGFDYRGEPTPFEWPTISSHFGVMDACGFPKNLYYYYQSWWTDKDVLHISPHWNWAGKDGQPIDVWVNSNADNVELFLNGKSLGKKDMPRNSHLLWSVAYKPGMLQAVAYKKGRKITSSIETTGAPTEVVITPYKTTMLANGKDATVINVKVIDSKGREVPDANNLIYFSVSGRARILGVGNGDPSSHEQDTYNDTTAQRHLFNGKCQVILQTGNAMSEIKFEAKAEGLYPGSTTIFSIKPGPAKFSATQHTKQVKVLSKPLENMLGADISFLPELEAKGISFSDKGIPKDAIEILKAHGFNYVRLRIFNNPAADSGYSPGKGFCDLEHTLQMAKRVKAAGMKLLLDFHYSDYWADPQQQYKPAAWKGMNFTQLKNAVKNYTADVMTALKQQNTLPDMVQTGNEINHGMLWPDGNINNLDSLAQLINAGIEGVKNVSANCPVMLHVALGGQNDETLFFLTSMMERGIQFDVIGLSYYPKWHGTLEDLRDNMNDLARRYPQDIVLVEYSALKKEVNDLTYHVDGGKGKGTFIWEPLSTWEKIFDNDGKSNDLILIYDELSKTYIQKK